MAANSDSVPDVTGIILAGGGASRLGRDKAFETLQNRRIIDRVAEVISQVCQDVLIVTSENRYQYFAKAGLPYTIITDDPPEKAAIGGLYTGIRNMKTLYGMVVACDMPFLNGALLRYMANAIEGYDAVVPKVNGLLEPLHAVYSRTCLHALKTLLGAGRLGLSEIFKLVNVRFIGGDELNRFDPLHLSYFNVNTEADLIEANFILNRWYVVK